jgi:proteic killer suppression protein
VIKTFRHRGLERFFKTGSKTGIQPAHDARLRILLKGDPKGHRAVAVNRNWRLKFSFEGEDAIFVDYRDYH